MAKLKGLGKGLDALLSSTVAIAKTGDNAKSEAQTLRQIALDKIHVGKYQPRQIFNENELNELATSISANGVIQPLVLRKSGLNYEIIAGERRFRAAKLAGLNAVPAVIREFTDKEALAIALIENVQRKDLTVVEEAIGYKRLAEEFNITHEDIAKITGRSRSHITNILRLLNLPEEVQNMLLLNELDMGHARALLPLGSRSRQISVAREIVALQLTTSDTEKLVAQMLNNQHDKDPKRKRKSKLDSDIFALETKLANMLGMVVSIKHGRHGNGKVVLKYSSLDELDTLLRHLK